MNMLIRIVFAALLVVPIGGISRADSGDAASAIRAEIEAIRSSYESRILELESRIAKIEEGETSTKDSTVMANSTMHRKVLGRDFNPSIGIVLNGRFARFTEDTGEIPGFGIGHEGERGREGVGISHSELNFSANVDDKFFGSLTAALVREDGEDKVELEEAYIQTLPGLGLFEGLTVKAGRALWTLGYLNEHHVHTDDFADRPLPYRVFLNGIFNDDGVEVSYLLPTDFYSEIGGGVFRGDDFPFGGSDGEGIDAWSLFARVGGDISENQNWRLGGSLLSGKAYGGRNTEEGAQSFVGDTDLYVADLRYTWAPTGNPKTSELILQGEYFWRDEKGTYADSEEGTGAVAFDDTLEGWYAQAVYKFKPQWRLGLRYGQLDQPDVPLGLVGSSFDSQGFEPSTFSAMLDWTNSEFSRMRIQFNRENLASGYSDDQFIFQYIMSFGAHGAHKY